MCIWWDMYERIQNSPKISSYSPLHLVPWLSFPLSILLVEYLKGFVLIEHVLDPRLLNHRTMRKLANERICHDIYMFTDTTNQGSFY